MKTVKSTTIYFLSVLCPLVMLGCKQKVDEDESISEVRTNTTGNKVIITGQLVKKNGSPFAYGQVIVNEFKDGKAVFKVGEGGKWLNPGCKVDNEGRFTLELDLDVFKGVKEFMLQAILNPNMPNISPLRERDGDLIVFGFSEGAKNLDLGEIVVE